MNKKLKYFYVLLVTLLLASCNPMIEVEAPEFNVSTEGTTFKAGQAIRFLFSGGNVNNIAFYSGEALKEYDFRDKRVIFIGDSSAVLSFQTSVQLGTQANQISILASTNFNGDYSSIATVKAATWTDITNRFTWGTAAAFVASGTKDMRDLIVPGQPIYFAFKYLTKPQATNGVVRTWYIQSFALTSNKKLDGTITLPLTDQATAGFRIVDENPVNAPARSLISATRLTLNGNWWKVATDPLFDPANPIYNPLNPIYHKDSIQYQPTAIRPIFVPFDPASPYNDPTSEHWAVTKPIRTDSVNLGPDWSISVKGALTAPTAEYAYTYTKPGTYKAVFIAANNSIDNVQKVVKEITFTITQ